MKAQTLLIETCPTCGSDDIHKVRRNIKGEAEGRRFVAPHVEFYECGNCGEKIYPPQAMHQIEAHSTTRRKPHALRA